MRDGIAQGINAQSKGRRGREENPQAAQEQESGGLKVGFHQKRNNLLILSGESH
jgi:hypothetical protein